jgi:hypothetical protein
MQHAVELVWLFVCGVQDGFHFGVDGLAHLLGKLFEFVHK